MEIQLSSETVTIFTYEGYGGCLIGNSGYADVFEKEVRGDTLLAYNTRLKWNDGVRESERYVEHAFIRKGNKLYPIVLESPWFAGLYVDGLTETDSSKVSVFMTGWPGWENAKAIIDYGSRNYLVKGKNERMRRAILKYEGEGEEAYWLISYPILKLSDTSWVRRSMTDSLGIFKSRHHYDWTDEMKKRYLQNQ